MPNNSGNNFIDRFAANVRSGRKVSLADIRKAEKAQNDINAARKRIANALERARRERNQEGGRRKTYRRRGRAGTRRRH